MRKIFVSLLTAWAALGVPQLLAQSGEFVTLIPQGSVWKFYDLGVNLGTTWRQFSYPPETNWQSGAAQLGFGDGDEVTVVNGGPSTARYITTYFRRSFVVDDPSVITNLTVSLLRDDGGVVFLNGTEVFRSNMPLAPAVINYNTVALNAVPAGDETVNFYSQSVDPALLLTGTNVLAVEIHQQGPTSSDLSFDLRLEGIRVPNVGPPLIVRQPQNRSVLTGSNATFQVSAVGTQPLRFQWSLNGTNIPGATNATLPLTSVAPKDAGSYRVAITNSLGSILSAAAMLTVLDFDSGIREDVEPDIHPFFWSQFSGTVLGVNYGGSVSGSNSLWFGGTGDRSAITRPFNTVAGGAVQFYLRMADNSRSFWELPDLPGEGVVLEYSTNAGSSWVTLATWDTVVLSNWTYQFFELPSAAQSAQTFFRWRQLSNSGDCCDNWALDDIGIALPPSAPTIFGQPTDQVAAVGFGATFSVGVAGIHPLAYQWRFNGADVPDATNATLTLTNLTFVNAGQYSVFISNSLGSAISSNATLSVEDLGVEFRIASLSTNGAFAIDHDALTGGERGGFAVCGDHLLYSGEFGIAGFDLDTFSLDTTLPSFTGFLVNDLETGLPYALGNGTNLLTTLSGTPVCNSLLEVSPATGRLTGRRQPLTTPIPLSSSYGNLGLFSGWGRIVIHTGSRAYNISARSGLVTDLGAMTSPSHQYSYGLGAYWGVAEYFSNAVHVVYSRDSFSIRRTRIPDGFSTNVLSGANFGQISHLSVSPRLNRWYFHHTYSSLFLSGSEVLGYADATFVVSPSARPPVIASQPSSQSAAFGSAIAFRVGVSGSFPMDYQWQFNGMDLPDATNSTLTVAPVSSDVVGNYSVRVSNQNGSMQSSNATLNLVALPADKFQVTKLGTNNSYVVDHFPLTGDNRGAIAVSSNRVFYSGDASTARFDIGDLSHGTALARIFDALVSDLQTERVYSLANGTNLLVSTTTNTTVTHLMEHDPDTGLPTGNRIALSASIPLAANYGNIGLFSGYGRIVLFDGFNVFHIAMPSGQVTRLGTLPPLAHASTESWAYWGVAEFFNSTLHLIYVRNSYSVARTRLPDAFTTTLSQFDYLANIAAFTVSPHIGRWYFHFYGTSQFGSGNEMLGFADAIFKYSAPPLPPRLLIQPTTQTAADGSTVRLKVSASGTAPLLYHWSFEGNEIDGATNATLVLSNISFLNIGSYSVTVVNEFGTSVSSNATLNVVNLPGENFRISSLTSSNAYVIEHRDLTSYDRGGIGASSSRIFYNGNVATAGYSLDDLSGGAISPTRGDALASDLRTEILYSLGNGLAPLPYGGGMANSLIQLDSYTGETTTNVISLSAPIDLSASGGNIGIFSGYGRIVVHNSFRAYDILLPSGKVTELGVMTVPAHNRTSGWAYWGVAEYYQGLVYLALVQDSANIVRVRVPDGAVTTILNGSGSTYVYLGNMNCITVAPYRNRWYFHHEYYSSFSPNFNDTLGFANATFDFAPPAAAPTIVSQPADKLAIGSRPFSLSVAASGKRPLTYQWQFNGTDLIGATNATLFFPEASTALAGTYRVAVSNNVGSATSRDALVTVRDLFAVSRNFAISALLTNNSRVVDHNAVTGDDRGGIALSSSAVFYSGDTATGRFLAGDLSNAAGVGQIYDALVSNLRTETVYTLAQGTNILTRNGGVATALIQLDGFFGTPTSTVIPLSSPIVLSNSYYGYIGFFSGYDRIVVHNGQRVYSIELPDGTVFDHGAMTYPTHRFCDNWAYWGVAEQIDNSIYITYVRDSQNIVRTHIPDGATTVLARFSNLSDMCSITVSPSRNRWYFHHEGSSQFGGTAETIGYADASFESPASISGLYNFTILEGSTLGPIPFRVYDATGQSNLTTVIALSSNTNLVASSNIVITGEGTNWSLSAFPYANSNGSSTITVVAQVGTHAPVLHAFTLNVTPVNNPPSFTIPATVTSLEDRSQYFSSWITNLTAGPRDEANAQTMTVTVTNDNPSLFSTQPSIYNYAPYADLNYSPAANAYGTATVTVTVRDSGGAFNGGRDTTVQTFTINILPVNDRPSFTPGPPVTVLEDAGPQLFPFWATNISAGPNETNQMLTFTLSANDPTLFANQPAIDSAGNLSFTPALNASGSTIVFVTLRDDGGTNNSGADTFVRSFSITISAVNDAPTALKGPDPVVFEDSGPQAISNWLSSVAAGPTNEFSQSVSITLSVDNTNLFSSCPLLDTNGILCFTAATNAFGVANGTIRLADDGGTANGGTNATLIPFTITVLPVNDAPSFAPGPDQTVSADAGPQAIPHWATSPSAGPDNEASQTLTFVLSNSNPRLFSVQPTINSAGTLTFAPARNGDGTADVFVTLHDNGGTTNGGVDSSTTALFHITVIAVAHAPYANSQTFSLNEDTPTAITLSAGDIDGDPLTYTITAPLHGTLSGAPPNLIYTPAANYFGSDSFSFQVSDGGLQSDVATVTLAIQSVNDAPVPVARAFGPTQLGTNQTNAVFLAPDNLQAMVIFDGTGSSDIESNAFQCFWYEQGETNVFGTGLRATNVVELGSYTVVLYVWDGGAGASGTFPIEVITPADAVARVMVFIDDAAISRSTKESLVASLKNAAKSFAKVNLRPAINELLALQNKVKAQIQPDDPVVAAQIQAQVQQIIDALNDYAAPGRGK